jgi:hypothetical protein
VPERVEAVDRQRQVVEEVVDPLDALGVLEALGQVVEIARDGFELCAQPVEVLDQRPGPHQRGPPGLERVAEAREGLA